MINRTIYKHLVDALKAFPVVVITGARQIGKSTLVFQFKKQGFNYVSLDDIDERRLALTDPKYFIERHGYPLIIDEVQYAPILMEVIEEIVNKKRINQEESKGLFILTGSQVFQLMENISQSMAGRAAVLRMEPLSRNEILNREEVAFLPKDKQNRNNGSLSISELFEQIIKGFYPEVYSNEMMTSEMFYSRYVATYIDRDINEISNIKDKNRFYSFMQILASLTAQQLNVASIARSVGVSETAIKDWLSVLETTGLIYYLQSYNENSMAKRVVKSNKVYFADTGLAAYLAKINDAATLEASIFAGSFMETYVMNEIRKSYINNGQRFDGTYYRDSNQNEIDLVLLQNAKLYLIEIKKGISFNLGDVKSFKQLENSIYPVEKSCIISNTKENYALNSDVSVISVNEI